MTHLCLNRRMRTHLRQFYYYANFDYKVKRASQRENNESTQIITTSFICTIIGFAMRDLDLEISLENIQPFISLVTRSPRTPPALSRCPGPPQTLQRWEHWASPRPNWSRNWRLEGPWLTALGCPPPHRPANIGLFIGKLPRYQATFFFNAVLICWTVLCLMVSDMVWRSSANVLTALCSISTSSSVHLTPPPPPPPVVPPPWSCIVRSPRRAKASPADVKISATLLELLMITLKWDKGYKCKLYTRRFM